MNTEIDFSKLYLIKIDFSKLYLIQKKDLVWGLFMCGIFISFYASLYPWFLWSISTVFMILASMFIVPAIVLDRTLEKPIFTREDYIIPTLCYFILAYYIAFTNANSLNAYISSLFNTIIFYSLFKISPEVLKRISNILAKSMGIILVPSILFFFLYLLGFPLPSRDMQFGDNFYSFTNYYFFLLDDRQLFAFIPRFQSIFLEPTYLGSTAAILLMTQRGKWKKWYNVTMIFSILISFSLAGYVYLTVIIFLNLWTKGKKIFKNAIIAVSIMALFTIGSFFYNNGDNMVHDLIMLRLEIEDGELAGDNRVTDTFNADFENFLSSSDIIFGRDFDNEFGNSGFKVIIYDLGIVGLLLYVMLYFTAIYKAPNIRSTLSTAIVALLIFIVDGFVLWFGRFIPLYCAAYDTGEELENGDIQEDSRQEKEIT